MEQSNSPTHTPVTGTAGRAAEQPRMWFRSERVYLLNQGAWYFRTREGVELGPYDSRFEAEIEAGLFRELIRSATDEEQKRSIFREFVLDAHATGHSLHPLYTQTREASV